MGPNRVPTARKIKVPCTQVMQTELLHPSMRFLIFINAVLPFNISTGSLPSILAFCSVQLQVFPSEHFKSIQVIEVKKFAFLATS